MHSFSVVGLIPPERKEVREIASFALDYMLVLTVFGFLVVAALLWPRQRGEEETPEAARA